VSQRVRPHLRVLVIDVGGTHVKMAVTGAAESRRFKSGKHLVPDVLVREVKRRSADWRYDVITLGYPGAVTGEHPRAEPGNLGRGWVGFDFAGAFDTPVRIVNDAALQALGSYDGGRMLFLGLGTGLGSAIVSEHVILAIELGCLPYTRRETLAERLGRAGRQRHGPGRWQRAIAQVVPKLKEAFGADYVTLGGGNAKHVDPLPEGAARGGNDDAFAGGFRLWQDLVVPHDRPAPPIWRVIS
jgi:polyphosphate glucokinase